MTRHPFWSDKEHIEMHTRFHTQLIFPGLVAKLDEQEERDLHVVLFGLAYPCPSPYDVIGNGTKMMQAYEWINSMVR